MIDGEPSRTAWSAALHRAAHQVIDGGRVFPDPVAVPIWDRYGWSAVKDSYESACITLGRTVRVELPDGTAVLGTAQSIGDDGRLIVMTTSGPRAFAAGDVHHLRSL
jgi:hypothetical protein